MTFDVASLSASQAVTPAYALDASPSATIATSVGSDEPVTVDTTPASPPPEVLAAIRTASQSYDSLAAAGRHVQFATDPLTGRVSAQLVDPSGGLLHSLSPSRVLELASGGPAALMKGN